VLTIPRNNLIPNKEGMPMAVTEGTALKVRPLGDRVVIEVIEEGEKTVGGIVLPDTAKEKPQEGRVVAVGSGRLLENGQKVEPEVSVGDTVIYSKYAGTEIKIDDKEYLILSERDILAVVEK